MVPGKRSVLLIKDKKSIVLRFISSSDVEDWFDVKNELPTAPNLSDEQILERIVGQSFF